MKTRLWKKLFLLTLVLLFLLPGCGQKKDETVTVYCLKEIDYGTSKQEYMYDNAGNVLEYYHYNSGRTVCTYDENNNTLQSDYYLSDNLIESTVYTYDENGRTLTKTVTDQSGVYEYTYTYDSQGDLLCETSVTPYKPFRKTVYSNIYSEDGALVQSIATSYDRTDAKTVKQVETFDFEGRLIAKEYYSGNDSIPTETFQRVYDSDGKLLTEVYDYSDPDRPSRKTQWEYDRKGRCLSESTYQDGVLFNRKLYTYDARGNLLETQDDFQVETETKKKYYRTEYTYDGKGNRLSEKTYYSFNGNWEVFHQHLSYSYDKKGNLLEEKKLSKDGSIVLSTAWTYDKAGNMRTKTHMPGNDSVQTSTYDEHGNLICYETTNSSGNSWKKTYHYITFELPWHLAEKVRQQQEAVFEALEVKWF